MTAGLEAYIQDNQGQGSQASAPAVETPRTPHLERLHKIVATWRRLRRLACPPYSQHFSGASTLPRCTATATAAWPRVGNWNLALVGSLMCPFLRLEVQQLQEKLGDFVESFTVNQARKKPLADWFLQYTEMVQLTADMVGACSQPVYDGLQWNTNPAELIHVIRTSELNKTPTPGEAGDPDLRRLLPGDLVPHTPPPEVPPAALPLVHIKSKNDEDMVDEAEQSPTPTSPAASPVEVEIELDATTEAEENDDVLEVESEDKDESPPAMPAKTWQGSLFRPLWMRRSTDSSGDRQVPQPPAPPERYEPLTGTAQWMKQHGTPPRVRGNRAMEISKALTQVLRHAAPRLGIHMEEDGFVSMGDLLKAPRFWSQWISEADLVDNYNRKSHVKDELLLSLLTVEGTPEYAAHGTYYDFYERILKRGLVAGGQQGATFRTHVHLVEYLPWEGP